jgi:hypothetical protein
MIEKYSTSVPHPLLSISLELSRSNQANSFIERTCQVAAEQIELLTPVIKRTSVLPAMSLLLVWFFSFFFFDPLLPAYWKMPFTDLKNGGAHVSPGSIRIKKNTSIILKLDPYKTSLPSAVLTLSKVEGRKLQSRMLRPDSSGAFSLKLDSLKESFIYQFSYGGVQLSPETVTVIPPPELYGLKISLTSPLYIGDSVRNLPEGQGNFAAFSGTKATIAIESGPLSSAWLITGKDTMRMAVQGNSAHFTYLIKKETDYTFRLLDTMGTYSDSQPSYHIEIMADEAPVVHFLKPGSNVELQPAMTETLWVEGVDDFGIKTMQIKYCRNGECGDTTFVKDISPSGKPKIFRTETIWNMAKLSLYPGDTLFYWAHIQDNKPFSPFQTATSDTFWFRVPTFNEIHDRLLKREKEAEQNISNVRKEQDNFEDKIDKLIKSATGKNELSWDQKQIVKDLQGNLKAQADSLQNAMDALQKNVESLKQQGILDDEITQKMEQIQKTLEDLIKQYGDSLLAGLKDKPNISMDDMMEAVEKMEQMLPELSERLDNTLQFLEMLKKDREMAMLAMRAEQLSREQTQLSGEKQSAKSADYQAKLLSKVDELHKDIASASENKPPSAKMVDSLRKEMEQQLLDKQYPTARNMNNMGASLSSLSQELREMMSSSKAEQKEKEKNLILDIAYDVLNIAQWQKKLQTMTSNDNNRDRIVKSQVALHESLKKLNEQMEKLKTVPPSILQQLRSGFLSALETSQETIASLSDSEGSFGMIAVENRLYTLAKTLLDIVSGMEQQCNKGESGEGEGNDGLMGGLKKLSGKQAAINAATSELLKALMNGTGSQGGAGQQNGANKSSEEAKKAVRDAQKALADQLNKLAEKYGKTAGEGMKKRVEELEKEARRIAAMLENPNADIEEKQNQFLSRMLQSTLSLNRQNEEKEERKSNSARKVFNEQQNIKSGDIYDDPDTFHLIRRKALQGNYPENYRNAVKAYFDSLGVLYLKE